MPCSTETERFDQGGRQFDQRSTVRSGVGFSVGDPDILIRFTVVLLVRTGFRPVHGASVGTGISPITSRTGRAVNTRFP